MKALKDLSNLVFGKWKVTSEYEIRINTYGRRSAYWLCECECGTKRYVIGVNLVNGNSTQCKSCGSKRNKGETARNTVLCGYKCDARDRNYEWSLPDSYCFELFVSSCFYCGDLPRNVSKSQYGSGDFVYNGIDRKDNSLGYTIENTVPCCRVCNRAKSNLSYEEWASYLSRVATRQKGRR